MNQLFVVLLVVVCASAQYSGSQVSDKEQTLTPEQVAAVDGGFWWETNTNTDNVNTHTSGDAYAPTDTHTVGGTHNTGDAYAPTDTHTVGETHNTGDAYAPTGPHPEVVAPVQVEPAYVEPIVEPAYTDPIETIKGVADLSTACTAGFDCVDKYICIDGVIDTSGGGLLQQRIKSSKCEGDNVCCRIPGYVEPLGQDQCHVNEDCVSYDICTPEGIIDVTGGSLLDKRIRPPGTCVNHEYPDVPAVCCLIPYKCPEYQECVYSNQCGADGLIDKSGSLTSYFQNGIPCKSDDGLIEGICCVPGAVKDSYPVATTCGVRNGISNDIHIPIGYGKEDAAFGEFPWMAIIFLTSNQQEILFKCGAVLISDKHLLTAAHCVENLKPADIGVRLGEYEVNSVEEPLKHDDYYVKNIAIHAEYNPRNSRNNIALIELTDPVAFKYHINTICLANAFSKFGHNCVATGWGKQHFEGDYQHILKKIDLPIVEHNTCQTKLRNTVLSKWFQLHQSFACAGGEAGVDTCTGDGGGPLVCQDPTSQKYYLAGLVSSGLGCGNPGVPGLYANVPYFTQWIEDKIAEWGHVSTNLPHYHVQY